MRFDDFCDFVQSVVLDEMDQMYEASSLEEWPSVEEVLRKRLNLKGAFKMRKKRDERYLSELNTSEQELYDELRAVRRKIAGEQQMPAYTIFTNRTLAEMCRALPFTMDELQKIYGVGVINSEKYGQLFLDAIHRFIASRGAKESGMNTGAEGRSTGSSESIEISDSAESSESTGSREPTENSEPTEGSESTEISDSAKSSELLECSELWRDDESGGERGDGSRMTGGGKVQSIAADSYVLKC